MKQHTRFSKETMESTERYLQRTGARMYTKNAGSSDGALWEREGYTVNMRITDLTHDYGYDYVLLEIFPGIMVRVSKKDEDVIDIPCYKNVCAYCDDFIKPGFGAMEVSKEHRDIYFKIEIPIRENALSESTLETIERHAAAVIEQHRDALAFLAHTYVPYKKVRQILKVGEDEMVEPLPDGEIVPSNIQMFNASLESIRNHLEKHSNHNVVAEGVDENGNPTWKCEVFAGRDHYFLEFIANQHTGLLTFKAMDGPKNTPISEDTRREVAAYMAETSSVRKVGYLWTGGDEEGMCCVTNASLVDGIISTDTIDLLEGLLIKSLDDVRAKANALAFGEELDDDNSDDREKSRMAHLRKILGRDEDDDDDSDDSDRMPHSLSDMMADVMAHLRSTHDDVSGDFMDAGDDDDDDEPRYPNLADLVSGVVADSHKDDSSDDDDYGGAFEDIAPFGGQASGA